MAKQKEDEGPQLTRFRLMVSQHIGPDYDQEPVTYTNPHTGQTTTRYPSKKYEAGDDVPSEVDLVKLFGGKFQYLQPTRARARAKLAVAKHMPEATDDYRTPGGDVVEGHPTAGQEDDPEAKAGIPDPTELQYSREDLESLSVADLRRLA
jgi:hypothetical protein